MSPLLLFAVYLHIVAGGVAIVAGTLALVAAKGSSLHRRIGVLFAVAMLSMSSLATCLAFTGTAVKPADAGNVLGGVFTFYLVATAWSSVNGNRTRTMVDSAALLLGLALGIAGMLVGRAALRGSGDPAIGTDAGPYFFIGGLALILVASDVHRLLVGRTPRQRVARHLWRMGLALWIAASSLFIGQTQVFPEALRRSNLLYVPSVAILLMTMFWWARTLRRGPPVIGPSRGQLLGRAQREIVSIGSRASTIRIAKSALDRRWMR